MIRALIADDQALVRGGFGLILGAESDIEVVAEAADGPEAVELTRAHRPDVLLMDVRMPGPYDGIEATRRLVEAMPAVRVLILTTFDMDRYVYAGFRAGASGFLLKDVDPPDLVHAVRTVARGDALLAPAVTRRLVAEFVGRPPPTDGRPPSLQALTDREVEVLREMAAGRSNAEIAGALFLSEATVKTHVTRVLAKLGLRDRVQAVVLAYETGFVRPGVDGHDVSGAG